MSVVSLPKGEMRHQGVWLGGGGGDCPREDEGIDQGDAWTSQGTTRLPANHQMPGEGHGSS